MTSRSDPRNSGGGLAPARTRESAPRLALTRDEAAASLGMSLDSFERYVQPDIKIVRRGRLRLVPVRELERWIEREALGLIS